MEQKNEIKIKLLQGAYLNKLLKKINYKSYPLIAPESATGGEYIVYQRTSMGLVNTSRHSQYSIIEAMYTLLIVSDNYSRGLNIASEVINLMNDYTDTDIADIQLVNTSESYNEFGYIQQIELKIITI